MHVLQVNKFLFGKGGAETVMFRTADLLTANDHEVSFFAMQDDRNIPRSEAKHFPRGRYYGAENGLVRRVRDAGASIYSFDTRRSLRRLLSDRTPDVAHLHNIYHQLTLSILDELHARHIPIVMTLHDYKPVCPNYLAYTENAPCHRCVGSHPGHAVVHRCIKDSRAASVIAATEAILVRARQLYGRVDAFIAPSHHLANMMATGGLPADRIHVLPNFLADEQFRDDDRQPYHGRPMVLFVGRLEEVKGIRVLLAAAKLAASELDIVVVGSGPLESEVEAAANSGIVSYPGRREWDQIAWLMDRARATVVPSLWEENCPMVVLEAGARGCTVVASDRGGLVELVNDNEDGLLFPAGDSQALAAALIRLAKDRALSAQLGSARYARTRAHNTATAHLPALLATYRKAIHASLARAPSKIAADA
jgi:glycosyltransferase involved in cell wall biosynthesis